MADEITNAIKGSISYTNYETIGGFGNNGNSSSKGTGGSGVNYPNQDTQKKLETQVQENKTQTTPTNSKAWEVDIAQSHHFTVQLRPVGTTKKSDKYILTYKVSSSPFGNFLPVKSMSLTYSGYETMILPFSSFSDFPLMRRRKIEIVNLTCYDEDTSMLENALMYWNEECFPGGRYVAYMDNVVKELIYKGYTVDGRESFNIRRFVIPIGQPQVNRDYEENDAKMITFSLACVGDGSTCATGASTQTREQPVESAYTSNESSGAGGSAGSTEAGGGGGGSSWGSEQPLQRVESVSAKIVGSSNTIPPAVKNPYVLPGAVALQGYKVVKTIAGKALSAISKTYPHFDDNGNRIK